MKRPRSAPSEPRTGALLVCGLFSGVNLCGLLLPRDILGIRGERRLGYELGSENLNGRATLLRAPAVLVMVTLGWEVDGSSAVVLPESLSQFGGELWDAVSFWGLFGKVRNGILLYCGSYFPQHVSTGKCVPEFVLEMGWGFRRPSVSKKASGAVALEAFLSIADEYVSCSWSDARRRERSCIPRRWG